MIFLIDTNILLSCRNKRETKSYIEITESLGVDDPSEILFVTDVYQEATAAKAAGNDILIYKTSSSHFVGTIAYDFPL